MFVSIMGDSISTYQGYNPEGYAVFYDGVNQRRNDMHSVYDTWWAKINQALNAYLCVNNSYSGSRVSGNAFPSACCGERTTCLHTSQYTPDVILIYMGVNDFGSGVPIKSRNLFNKNAFTFEYAYRVMLSRIKKQYPNSRIICSTLMRSTIKGYDEWEFPEYLAGVSFEDYNIAIRNACSSKKCEVVDIAALNMRYETLDGVHPTAVGHSMMAEAWMQLLT